jgi:hypothetical protein
MPIYFNDVAPYCPVSRDQPTGPMPPLPIRTVIPRVHDLPSAIAAVNIMRTIIDQIVRDRVINNVYGSSTVRWPKTPPDRDIDKRKDARWVEQKSKRVKRKYKYYVEDSNGVKDRDSWVMTERIERMVWYDRAWKTYLVFNYGDKDDEGEQVAPAAAATASE